MRGLRRRRRGKTQPGQRDRPRPAVIPRCAGPERRPGWAGKGVPDAGLLPRSPLMVFTPLPGIRRRPGDAAHREAAAGGPEGRSGRLIGEQKRKYLPGRPVPAAADAAQRERRHGWARMNRGTVCRRARRASAGKGRRTSYAAARTPRGPLRAVPEKASPRKTRRPGRYRSPCAQRAPPLPRIFPYKKGPLLPALRQKRISGIHPPLRAGAGGEVPLWEQPSQWTRRLGSLVRKKSTPDWIQVPA